MSYRAATAEEQLRYEKKIEWSKRHVGILSFYQQPVIKKEYGIFSVTHTLAEVVLRGTGPATKTGTHLRLAPLEELNRVREATIKDLLNGLKCISMQST